MGIEVPELFGPTSSLIRYGVGVRVSVNIRVRVSVNIRIRIRGP